MKIAVVDLGTNSVRCDIYWLTRSQNPRLLHRFREMVRLGDGVYTSGAIEGVVLRRTVRAFQKISSLIRRHRVTYVHAVGTSALRRSKNQKQVIRTIFEKTGIQVRPISGKQESKLIARGILFHEYLSAPLYALVDIGGGSTEISFCRKQKVVASYSVQLGANRLAQSFLSKSRPTRMKELLANVRKLQTHCRLKLAERARWNDWPEVPVVLGSSGTIRAIKKLIKKQKKPDKPFRKEHVDQLCEWLIALDKKDYMRIPGMEDKRLDLILPGALLFREIMRFLGAKQAFHTERSLRDGLLLEAMDYLEL